MRKPFYFAFLATMSLAVVVPWFVGGARDGQVVRRNGEPSIVRFRTDAEVEAAVEKAKATIADFLAVIKNPTPNQTDFEVKHRFVEGEIHEHIWINPVRWENGRFIGEVANLPLSVKNVREGQLVSFPDWDISDWKYLEDGKLMGGFTILALIDRLSPEERREWEARFGLAPKSAP